MKKNFYFFICMLMSTFSIINTSAQTETFDIATFIPPQGWQRSDSNGTVLYQDMKSTNGKTSFCFIYLYPSHSGSANAIKNFESEWNYRVVRTTGTKTKPKTQSEKTPDGWTVVTGYTNITQQGVTFTSLLVSASGFGKVMSILVNVAGPEYMTAVQSFLNTVELNAKTVVDNKTNNNQNMNISAPGTLADYVFTPPEGWTTTQYPDGIVLNSPGYNTGERCLISLWPMRPAGNKLLNDANSLFIDVFKTYELRSSSTPGSTIKGISQPGWEYAIVKKSIGKPGGDYATLFGFVFVAKLGNQLAAISGMSKDPLVSSCFGLMLTDVWPKFFYSLEFKNWKSSEKEQTLAKRIPGVWMSVTATAADRYVIAPNGRYASAAGAQSYTRLSSTEVLQITDVYFGDGSYAIKGNHMIFKNDNNKDNPLTSLVRLEQESRDDGKTWVDKLYLLQKSGVDGKEYEVCYERQQ